MSQLDWFVLIFTLFFIVIYGVWKTRGAKDLKSYLKGNNDAKWWGIGISIMATQASAITFLSTPGQAYSDGMISAGYAAILVDCFNKATQEEIKEVTTETFTSMGLRSLLSMNRANGFNQMVEMMKACK